MGDDLPGSGYERSRHECSTPWASQLILEFWPLMSQCSSACRKQMHIQPAMVRARASSVNLNLRCSSSYKDVSRAGCLICHEIELPQSGPYRR